MRIVEGRTFSDGEAGRGEALITRTFARSGFFDGPRDRPADLRRQTSWDVVGILEDISQFRLDRRAGSEMYIIDFVPAPPGLGGTYFAVRTDADPPALVDVRARHRPRNSIPTATVDNIATMEQIVSNAMSGRGCMPCCSASSPAWRWCSRRLASTACWRISCRIARGRSVSAWRSARDGRQVVALVLRQTAVLTVGGMVVGVAGAAALSRYLEGLLFGLTPLDVTTFAAVVVMFGVVAALASYVPARRATRVDPLVALRSE